MPSWSQQLCAETTATSETVAVSLAATNPPAIGSITTEKVRRKTIMVRIPITGWPLQPRVPSELRHGQVKVPRKPLRANLCAFASKLQ